MMAVERIFFDTNILIDATDRTSPWHAQAVAALQATQESGMLRVISTQVLREFYAFATRNSTQGQNHDWTRVRQAQQNILEFRASFQVLEDTHGVSVQLFTLTDQIAIGGRQIHDANLVATMLSGGVTHLLTNNPDHFTRFAGMITVVPLSDFPQPAA